MQINPTQMDDAALLANDYPNVQILLNHTGWPDMTNDRGFDEWRLGMKVIAACENLSVKISGYCEYIYLRICKIIDHKNLQIL